MIEKISLRIFWVSMVLCAMTFLTIVWIPFAQGPDTWMPLRMQIVVTFFVIGLAAILTWLPLVVYKFHQVLQG